MADKKITKIKIGGLSFDLASGSMGGGLVEDTYANILAARNGGTLIPGTFYKITDYVTTTSAPDTTVANPYHYFDVVILALDAQTFAEQAYAMHSSRDTAGYFDETPVESWQIWYSLDNDSSRFDWAASSGKGVIYRMIDENENDCPYDFKNIMFARYFTDDDIPTGGGSSPSA